MRSTFLVPAARCRRFASNRSFSTCTHRSGMHCATRSSALIDGQRQRLGRTPMNNEARAVSKNVLSGVLKRPGFRRRRPRPATSHPRWMIITARLVTLVIVFGGWQLFTQLKIVDPFFFGRPSGIVAKLGDWVTHGTAYGSLWLQLWITVKEAALGFMYGVIAGIFFGVLLGQVRFLSDVLSPYIKVLNAVPRIVLGSIFVVWLGLGTTSKVALAAVLVFFVVFFNAFQGVREVSPQLVAHVRVLGASRWDVVRHVILPSALSWIIASLH